MNNLKITLIRCHLGKKNKQIQVRKWKQFKEKLFSVRWIIAIHIFWLWKMIDTVSFFIDCHINRTDQTLVARWCEVEIVHLKLLLTHIPIYHVVGDNARVNFIRSYSPPGFGLFMKMIVYNAFSNLFWKYLSTVKLILEIRSAL